MANTRFFRCAGCGNFVMFVDEKTACTPKCCGEPMVELTANTTDAATEKHVPVAVVEGNKVCVKVGSVAHPMLEEHYIKFIYLETKLGGQIRYLNPGQAPEAEFVVADGDEPVAVYEFCNLHGLWKAEI